MRQALYFALSIIADHVISVIEIRIQQVSTTVDLGLYVQLLYSTCNDMQRMIEPLLF